MWKILHEWLWGAMLPDKCQGADCCRKGVRGNENIVNGKVLCDYCTVKEANR
jgi:hypothetical protein